MGIRQANLGPLKAGITRLREKGGASAESLFDLLNGYVDASGAPTSRDGTSIDRTLPAGTKGLCSFEGKKHVFAIEAIDPGSSDYVVDILVHPDPNFDGTLAAIHFAKPFLGFLYVVAEFSNGDIYHYWLQTSGVWQSNHVYQPGDVVSPSVPNGYHYKATVAQQPTAWAPSVVRNVGDTVQPTEANGFYYVVTETDGVNPASGLTEPTWITEDGAQVVEDVDTTPAPTDSTSTTSGGSPAGPRYDNLPGRNGSVDV